MTTTSNYQLSQWSATDQIKRTDFNADNQKIDAALATLSAGQLRIATGGYTGNGKYGASNPNTLTFPFVPKFVILYPTQAGSHAYWHILIPGTKYGLGVFWNNSTQFMQTTWSGATVTYHADTAEYQNNMKDYPYKYIAIG